MPLVLGLDPGFASLGHTLVELDRERATIKAVGVFRTAKLSTKQHVLAADDNLRRARDISAFLTTLCGRWDPKAICAESMSFPRNASAAAKVAMAWGTIAACSDRLGIPVVQASPQHVKLAVCGRKDASKEDVQAALRQRFPELPGFLDKTPTGQLEHPYDAVGAVVACMDSEVLRLLRIV
jgi:crossover junction endodeoxyribonuclease RuvC